MAKSDKHKKRRKQEKAKTQLTGAKKLIAKPQNLFEPTLRSKKIVIREQLHSHGENQIGDRVEVTTRRKQNIKDILSALNHHNTNIKKDALGGLQELISTDGDVLISNLDKILGKIAGLTSDLESSVRNENLKVAEIIFAQINEDQVQPFWNLLLTHIKCSLTNLNPAIRYSCLNFLSLLISYFPNLVSNSNHIILPCIMNLVSANSSSATTSPSTTPSKSKEDITSSLKIEVDTKERIRVLSLITSCLDLKVATNSHHQNVKGDLSKTIEAEGVGNIGLYYPLGYQDVCFSDTSISRNHLDGAEASDNFWPQFVQSYLPLLCETWMEVRPSIKDREAGRGNFSLPANSIEILDCIVTVMAKLIIRSHSTESQKTAPEEELNLIKELRKKQGQSLKKYFIDCLPFSAVQDSQRKMVTSINLKLFHIAAELRLINNTIMIKFENYIKTLMKRKNLDSNQISLLLEIMCQIHLQDSGELLGHIINFGLDAGYVDIIHGFLLGITDPRKATAEASSILCSADWDSIASKLFDVEAFTPNPLLIKILSNIGLKGYSNLEGLLELDPILFKFKEYLTNDTEIPHDLWTSVVNLYYNVGTLKSLDKVDLPKPEPIVGLIHVLEGGVRS